MSAKGAGSVCAIAMACVLAACGGDGGSRSVAPPAATWTLTIDPAPDPTTVCNQVILSGKTFISPTHFRCCSGTAQEMTGVTVTWQNESSGLSGPAFQDVDVSFFGPFLENHRWSATVQLVIGTNSLVVRASDPAGRTGIARVSIAKTGASFSLGGRLVSSSGLGLGFFESGQSVALAGTITTTAAVSSGAHAGQFVLTCVPPGNYTVAPSSSAFTYAYVPPQREVTVIDADLSGLDMVAPAHLVEGRVTYSANGAASPMTFVTIGTGNQSLTNRTDADGFYRFVVPDGEYRVQPSDLLCPGCVFSPPFSDVTIAGVNATGIDFSRD